MLDLKSK